MKRMLLASVVGVVVVANGWGIVQAWRNRSEPRGGALELTERELPLEPVAMESTATSLRLKWNVHRTGNKNHGPVAWLDMAKLAELGFDCKVPLDSPSAQRHYSSMTSRPVFLALEYEGDTWPKAGAAAEAETRLLVVDAARDPDRLRERYPDRQRYIICRGLVRFSFRDREARQDQPAKPRIEGRIQDLYPAQVFVPLPHSRLLREVRRTDSTTGENDQPKEPRFAVRVCWGANYEPWVEGVRLLKAVGASQKEP